jgi:exosortase family protein XrtF
MQYVLYNKANNRRLIVFFCLFFLFYFLLASLYQIYLDGYNERVDKISSMVGHQSASILRFFGFSAYATDINAEKSTYLFIDGLARVKVIEGCNGLSVMVLFMAFILGFVGPLKTKAWFIPVGLLFIHLFNLSRIAILAWAVYMFGETGYPIYKEIFTVSVYLLVLAMWYLWVQKLGLAKSKKA